MITIGIFINNYAVDRPYGDWEKRKLESIDRPAVYRIENLVSLFLFYDRDSEAFKIAYCQKEYDWNRLQELKRMRKGLYILEVDSDTCDINSFECLSVLLENRTLNFLGKQINLNMPKNLFFSNTRSTYMRNFVLTDDNGIKLNLSNVERDLVEYYCEVTLTNTLINNWEKLFHNYVYKYLESEKIIGNIDISKVVRTLTIKVKEYFKHKVGGDDSYFVEEERQVSYPRNRIDEYLSNYLKLGNREIHRDSGYIRAEEMAIPGLKTGKWSEEETEQVRKDLIDGYSHIEHIFSVVDKEYKGQYDILNLLRAHRNNDGLFSYLFSQNFRSNIEKIIGGGKYVIEWENIHEIVDTANNKLSGLIW